jgi:hypothetical protein
MALATGYGRHVRLRRGSSTRHIALSELPWLGVLQAGVSRARVRRAGAAGNACDYVSIWMGGFPLFSHSGAVL